MAAPFTRRTSIRRRASGRATLRPSSSPGIPRSTPRSHGPPSRRGSRSMSVRRAPATARSAERLWVFAQWDHGFCGDTPLRTVCTVGPEVLRQMKEERCSVQCDHRLRDANPRHDRPCPSSPSPPEPNVRVARSGSQSGAGPESWEVVVGPAGEKGE